MHHQQKACIVVLDAHLESPCSCRWPSGGAAPIWASSNTWRGLAACCGATTRLGASTGAGTLAEIGLCFDAVSACGSADGTAATRLRNSGALAFCAVRCRQSLAPLHASIPLEEVEAYDRCHCWSSGVALNRGWRQRTRRHIHRWNSGTLCQVITHFGWVELRLNGLLRVALLIEVTPPSKNRMSRLTPMAAPSSQCFDCRDTARGFSRRQGSDCTRD
jgi:hypothetical protein